MTVAILEAASRFQRLGRARYGQFQRMRSFSKAAAATLPPPPHDSLAAPRVRAATPGSSVGGHTDEARVVSVSDQTVLAMEPDFSPIRLSFRDMQSE